MTAKEKALKDNGLKDYEVIYISGSIGEATSGGVYKEIIGYSLKNKSLVILSDTIAFQRRL